MAAFSPTNDRVDTIEMPKSNIFCNIPAELSQELFDNLVNHDTFKLQRIVSQGQATPPGQWYDQDTHEWVILLKGSAGIIVEGETEVVLNPGDYLHLPARRKHRVEWTDSTIDTLWLALHYPKLIS